MQKILLTLILSLMTQLSAAEKINILILNIDDLKNNLGCYGDKIAITPNIDRLAQRGTIFRRNYCQQAVCAASRVSMYTGMRPDSTGVQYLSSSMRDINPNGQSRTMPLRPPVASSNVRTRMSST